LSLCDNAKAISTSKTLVSYEYADKGLFFLNYLCDLAAPRHLFTFSYMSDLFKASFEIILPPAQEPIHNSEAPIGIFDSGIGGLTVAKAVHELLPNENLIYFGDTAHLPYGDKSTAAIQSYAIKICNFLLSRRCKVILIACNSAAAAAFDLVKTYVGSKAHVFSVIEPTVALVTQRFAGKNVGLIGTKQTVSSAVYEHQIEQERANIHLKALATPLLVPMIEEGFITNRVSHEVIENYLSRPELTDIQALILGCTHYPLIKKEIVAYYQQQVEVIDSSEAVAHSLKVALEHTQLLNKASTPASMQFYVSDYTEGFEKATQIFFGEALHLEKFPLWD